MYKSIGSVFAGLVLGTVALACPDFSGRHQCTEINMDGSKGESWELNVTQTTADGINYISFDGDVQYTADGKVHPMHWIAGQGEYSISCKDQESMKYQASGIQKSVNGDFVFDITQLYKKNTDGFTIIQRMGFGHMGEEHLHNVESLVGCEKK